MTIQAETFYQAKCDADDCTATFPDDEENDYGATHYPLSSLMDLLPEPSGEFDEAWTIDGDRHYCQRHAPGNVDCDECEGAGHRREGDIAGAPNWVTCAWCGGRGYDVPASPESETGDDRG